MIKKIVPWLVWSIAIIALLAGAYFIINENRLAVSGQGETPAFYGH
jgi:hypothetical protein